MSNGDQQPSGDGWTIWLAEQFGSLRGAIGEVRAQTMGNRQMAIEFYHHLTHRMDRMEDRITQNGGNGRLKWLRHVPWFKISLLLAATLLVATGHLTVGELKSYIVHKLTD